jgi:hypothetical protein
MTVNAVRLLLRCQPLYAFLGRPLHGDWEYILWTGDDRRLPR